jgi:centromere-localized protein 2
MQLFGPTSNLPVANPHTLTSILPEMESAVEDVEDEVRRLEEQVEALLEQMRGTVGALSDLRYGRLANGQLRGQVLDGLNRLENSCGN